MIHILNCNTNIINHLAPDRWTYIIPRNDGTVICGGTVDRENRQTQPDEAITKDVLKRCYQLYPEITHGKGPESFDIISINVGFRPGRKDGIRLEKEIKRNFKTKTFMQVIRKTNVGLN